MKIVKTWFLLIIALFGLAPILSGFAEDYDFFYGNGCQHCAKVEKFFDKNDIVKKYDVVFQEVYFNRTNLKNFMGYLDKLHLDSSQVGVPFLVINSGSDCTYLNGDQPIIDYFTQKLAKSTTGACAETANTGVNLMTNAASLGERMKFFGIMLPAALSDSINPCAFAVMLLLLSSILTKHKSKRKTILAGLMFALAVFSTYLAMGIGLFSALASTTNTTILKTVVGILGIVVGLANLKDYFWYGKVFVMEVPFSWRPKMADLIDRVSSPWGAFFVGILVSLFLLPCSSGPYFTILGYLSSQSKALTDWGYIYLIVYNLIFVLPMVVVAVLVSFGFSTVDKLAKIKHMNTKLIHLIVGLLMLGLGAYVLLNI
ncbi:MAG: cytochrome c biogenesis CcdA family protein [Candidatus Absconditabacteria bacterium]